MISRILSFLILIFICASASAQMQESDQRSLPGDVIRAGKPYQKITAPWITTFSSITSFTGNPVFLIAPPGSWNNAAGTLWSSNGTGLGINAPSSFPSAGNILDVKYNGTSALQVESGLVFIGNSAMSLQSGLIENTIPPFKLETQGGSRTGPNIQITAQSAYAPTTTVDDINLDSVATFNPVTPSTSPTYEGIEENSTINQAGSGTSGGITRSIYIKPTLTDAWDYRALEVASYTDTLIGNPVTSTFREVLIGEPTIAATSATQTVTTASTLDIVGAPAAGTNVTITTAWALNIEAGNANIGGNLYVGGTEVATTPGTGLAASGATLNSNAVYQVSYQPGLLSAINSTIGVNSKISKAATVDNIEGSAVTFSCVSNPTVTMYECGTSATCTSPTTIGSVTVTAAGTVVDGTVSSSSITAGDYIGWAMTAGTCASIDIAVTAQIHSN